MFTWRTPRLAAVTLIGIGLLVFVSCSSNANSRPTNGALEVQVMVSVCRNGECSGFPASDARVEFLDSSGDVVASGTAAQDGRFSARVPAGTYQARANLTNLGVGGTTTSLDLSAGGASEWTLYLQPAL